jgi:hypothetical protein
MISSKHKGRLRPSSWIFLIGLFFYGLFEAKNYILPGTFHREFFNSTIGIVTTVFISGCAFFSLRELLTETTHHRLPLYQALLSSILVFFLFLTFYTNYMAINRMLNKLENNKNILPDIIDKMRVEENPKARAQYARGAYFFYGARLSYLGDDNKRTYYEPTPKEVADRRDVDSMDAAVKNLRIVSIGLLNGVGDIALSVFLTFSICLLWAAYRITNPTSDRPSSL